MLAGEDGMGGDAHFQIEVPGWRPVGPRFPFSPEAQAGTRIYPRRDVHLDLLFLADDPGTLAGRADRSDDGAGPLAIRTGVEDFQ